VYGFSVTEETAREEEIVDIACSGGNASSIDCVSSGRHGSCTEGLEMLSAGV